MKTLEESLRWTDQQVGKSLDWPGSGDGPQCPDLVAYYLQFHGVDWPGAAKACDLWDRNLDKSCVRSDKPVPGAIAVWSDKVGKGYGHVAVVRSVAADGKRFTSLDQNYINFSLEHGSPAAWVQHDLANLRGFFVPNFAVPAVAPPEPVAAPAVAGQYKIQPNDTFWALEEKNGWKHGVLQELNPGLDPRTLSIGSMINIPRSAAPAPAAPRTHTVQPGESYWSIEDMYGIPHGTLEKINDYPAKAIPRYATIKLS